MGRSLLFKLLGAFAVVIVVLAVVAAWLTNRATEKQFSAYSARSGQLWAEQLAPALSGYYASNGTWDLVSDAASSTLGAAPASTGAPVQTPRPATPTPTLRPPTATPTFVTGSANLPRGMMGRGMSGGWGGFGPGTIDTHAPGASPVVSTPPAGVFGANPGSPSAGAGSDRSMGRMARDVMGPGMSGTLTTLSGAGMNWWATQGQRLVIADAGGKVVADSSGQLENQTLAPQTLAAGAPIQVDGKLAGTVLITADQPQPSSAAGQFLAAVNRSILLALLAAAAVAMLMGALLFFYITAPLRKLRVASAAIAAGDLSQRVPVRSRDELGELAVTFNDMADSLAQAETQRKQLVADLAHELRTPLSVMQGNLEAMQDGVLPLDAGGIASLHEETLLLGRLVADLRLLSLAESGQLKLELAEVEPAELVRKAAERLQHNAAERGVQLSVEAGAALPPVLADSDRIHQVLGNLVGNSLRYTPHGGTIILAITNGALAGAATHSNGKSTVVVSVTDTGPGVPADELANIFDRFYRADKSRSRSSGGSGLGLAIVKQVVGLHGGEVWAESPVWPAGQGEGYGTRVSFTLPAVRSVASQASTR